MTMDRIDTHPADPDDELLAETQAPDSSGDMADHDAIRRLVKELDLSGGSARIFRQPPGGAEYDYVGEIPVDGFTLEVVKRAYGGGRYRVKLATARGTFARTIKFSIDARFTGDLDRANAPQPQASNMGQDNLTAYLLKSSEQATQQNQMMLTLLVTAMQESQKTMATIIAAVAGKSNPVDVTPRGEPATRLIEVLTPFLLAQNRGGGGTSLGEIVEGIKVVKSLAEPAREEEKEEDMLDKVVKVGAPLLGAIFNRVQGPQQAARPVPNPRTVPGPTSPEDEQRARMEARVRDLAAQLRMVTPILVRAARRNSDVTAYLEVLDGVLDEEGRQILVEFLRRDDWIETMFGNHPDVVANAAWFGSLREVILNPDMIEEDDDVEGTEDEGPGNPPAQVQG